MGENKEADETMSGEGEAELAAEPTHAGNRSMRKTVPLKEGLFCSALNTGSLRIEETTEEEETCAVETPRAKKRKTGESPELPTELAEEMRTSTTSDIGAELLRRASEVTKVAETFCNLKGTHVKMLREVARSIAAGATEMVRTMDPAPSAFAIMERYIAALEAPRTASLWPRLASTR